MIPDDVYTDPDTILMTYGMPEDETLLTFYAQQVQNNSQMVDPRRPSPAASGFDPEQVLVPSPIDAQKRVDDFSTVIETMMTPNQRDD